MIEIVFQESRLRGVASHFGPCSACFLQRLQSGFSTDNLRHRIMLPNRLLAVLPFVLAAIRPATAQTVNAGTPEFFENKIRPILANNCFGCHTNSQLGGLRLDTLDGMKKGG